MLNSTQNDRRSVGTSWLAGLVLTVAACLVSMVPAQADEPPPVVEGADADARWATLKQHYFADVPIESGEGIIALDAPARAHDAAVVPISVTALDPDAGVRKLHLIVDQNPLPLAGVFTFADEAEGWGMLETRIRINEYTNVRAVAELDDGKLVMVSRFVKAAGGCSAPAMADLDAAMARAGKMQLLIQEATANSVAEADGSSPLESPLASATIKISHPNNSGMQFDQVSRNYIPAFFVQSIVADVDGQPLLEVQTNFSLSENPVVSLTFPGDTRRGQLAVHAVDSRGNRYEQSAPFASGS